MNQESFEMSPAARRRLDGYLDQIERLLMASGVERAERRSILDDVEAQALEMLQARTPQAEEADAEAVLARLDAPEDYARAAAESGGQSAGRIEPAAAAPPPAPAAGSTPSRLSRKAVIGALLLIPPMVLAPGTFFLILANADPPAPSGVTFLMAAFILFIPLLFLIAMCILGIAAIREIRNSEGRLYGMGLAVFDALLLPLLLLDGVLASFTRSTVLFPWTVSFGLFELLLFLLVLDGLLVWWVWKRVHQPPSVAQPGGRLWQSNIDIP